MIADMPKRALPYLQREITRHGKTVHYVRRHDGPRVRIKGAYGSPEFMEAYQAAIAGKVPEKAKPVTVGTVAWLVQKYQADTAWTGLSLATRAQRAGLLKEIIANAGHQKAKDINARSIREGMQRRAAKPHGANNWLKTMRGLFGWASQPEVGHVPSDPTRGAKLLSGPNDRNGYHTWTDDEVARFEARWPLGTRERLAFDLLLYTGLRRGDACRAGRQHLRNGVLTIVTEKTEQPVSIRLLPPLLASIAATPSGNMAFVVGEKGRPFAKAAFGNWFRDACREAGVPGVAHGLRKVGAQRAAEAGASENELNAWFGWAEGSRESARYVRGANRKKLAERLAERMIAPHHPAPVRGSERKSQRSQGLKKSVAPRADDE